MSVETLARYEVSYNLIEEQIKKLDASKRELRVKQEPYKKQIYDLMEKLSLEETPSGHKKKKFAPKAKKMAKTKKEKQKDAIAFLSTITKKDPQKVYQQFLETQKPPPRKE